MHFVEGSQLQNKTFILNNLKWSDCRKDSKTGEGKVSKRLGGAITVHVLSYAYVCCVGITHGIPVGLWNEPKLRLHMDELGIHAKWFFKINTFFPIFIYAASSD